MKSIALSTGGISLMLAAVALLPSSYKSGQQMQQMPAPEIATITLAPQTADLQTTFPATIKGKTDIDIRPQGPGSSKQESTRPAPLSTMPRQLSTQQK